MSYDSLMLSWAQQRKLFFVGGVIIICIMALGAYGFFAFYNAPDCFNNAKDGDERGVDCGGSCTRVCRADVKLPVIQFARTFEVEDGVWGAVTYGENQNVGVGSRGVPYVFKLYDENNSLLYERHGTAFIPPRKVFAIFEGKMLSGGRIPTRATFEFLEEPIFERMTEPELMLDTKNFEADEQGSSLQALITNPTKDSVEGVEVVALLFGTDGNVIGASATFVAKLPAKRSAVLTFTWPHALERPARTEILYTVPRKR